MNKRLIVRILLLATPLFFFFQNCGVKTPSVDAGLSSSSYSHNGLETSCAGCHESNRPKSSAGFIGLNASAPFDYSTHAAGVDCVSCHMMSTTGFRTQAEWANGYYIHPSTLASCTSCHSAQRPAVPIGPNAYTSVVFNHSTSGTGDCSGCHQKSLMSPFANYITANNTTWGDTDWAGGVAVPSTTVYDSSEDVLLTEYLPAYSGTTLSLPAPNPVNNVPVHMGMNHATSQITMATLDNCVTCHANAANNDYKPGKFHTALTAANVAQPTACLDCHVSGDKPDGFVGPVDTTRNPNTPQMKHTAVAWAKNAAGAYVPGATNLVTSDCVVCHQVPSAAPVTGNGWNIPPAAVQNNGTTAFFHASLAAKGLAQPSSCLDCHANTLPTGLMPATATAATLTKFDHSSHAAGSYDCVTCHAPPTTVSQVTQNPVTLAWANGKFHQPTINATLTSCSECHNTQRPTGTSFTTAGGVTSAFTAYNAAVLPFDVANHGNSLDCKSCHTPAAFTAAANWAGGSFNHVNAKAAGNLTACVVCHSTQRPAAGVGPNTYTVAVFNHSTDGQGDCIGCHQATVTAATYTNYKTANGALWGDTSWKGGVGMDINQLAGPDPSLPKTTVSPTPTHISSNSLPLGQITTSANSQQLIDQMLHASAQVANAGLTAVTSSTASVTCNACHKSFNAGAGTLLPVTFHAATGINNSGLTACKDCHVNTTPKDVVGTSQSNTPMDHFASLSGGGTAYSSIDCITCHGTTNAGVNFSGATFHANLGGQTPTNCTSCHFLTLPAGTGAAVTGYPAASTYVTGMKHTSVSVTLDCVGCHVLTNAQIVATASKTQAGWLNTANAGTAYYHKHVTPASISSCTDCHTTKPTGLTVSNNDTQHMNHASATVPNDCVGCHKTDLTAGATPTQWSKAALFHTTVPSPTTCQECHGLTNGGGSVAGTNNDIPAVATNSATVTTSFIAATAGVLAKIDHTEADVKVKDCNYCHTVVGMTGAKWKAATFHGKFSANSSITGNCATCHAGERPPNGVTTDSQAHVIPDHNPATLGNADCKSCHILPGTGSTTAPNWLGASGAMPATVTYPVPKGSTGWTALSKAHPAQVTTSTTHAITSTDCAYCHANYNSTASVKGWDHKDTTFNCGFCHFTNQQVVLPPTNFSTRSHNGASFTKSCNASGCHVVGTITTLPTWNATTSTWTGGSWGNP